MCSHVNCKMTFLDERLSIVTALVWFILNVSSQMSYETVILFKIVDTLVALVWFLSSVRPQMTQKISFICINVITLTALICFIVSERSFAFTELVWYLPSVYPLVIYKSTLLGEVLITGSIDMVCRQCEPWEDYEVHLFVQHTCHFHCTDNSLYPESVWIPFQI